jgi:hypothetical protein
MAVHQEKKNSNRLADEPGDSLRRDVDPAVRHVIGGAVDASEANDLFLATGRGAAWLNIPSKEFLERVSALEQKNVAIETLRKEGGENVLALRVGQGDSLLPLASRGEGGGKGRLQVADQDLKL